MYYNPLYLSITSFWKEDFRKRKPTHNKYDIIYFGGETLALFFLSFATALGSRFSFLLFYFLWLFKFADITPILIYFLFLLCLTLLARSTNFQNHIKNTYNLEVLKKIGWNSPYTTLINAGKKLPKGFIYAGNLFLFDETASLFILL